MGERGDCAESCTADVSQSCLSEAEGTSPHSLASSSFEVSGEDDGSSN